jgi:O-antigen ligase
LLLVGIYLTNSRGGLLVLLLEIAIWSAIRLGSVATGALAVALIPVVFAATRLSTMNAEEESAAGRVDAWYVALQLFREHPLFGVGYGLFADHNEITAHNSWMLVLAELGLPGYLLWFTLVGISLQMMWTVSRFRAAHERAEDANSADADRALAAALLWSGGGMMAAAFFLSRSYSILMFLFWGCAAGHYLGARRRTPVLPSLGLESLARRWAGFAIASIAVFFVLVRALLLVQ